MLYFASVREAKTSRTSSDVSGRIASIAMNCVIAFPLHSCSGNRAFLALYQNSFMI